jgi:hypothetical protein
MYCAPLDGRIIEVCCGSTAVLAYWDSHKQGWVEDGQRTLRVLKRVTGWRPVAELAGKGLMITRVSPLQCRSEAADRQFLRRHRSMLRLQARLASRQRPETNRCANPTV